MKLGYEFSRELTEIYNQELTIDQAREQINVWMKKVKKSKVTCFETFLETLKTHKTQILNYFNGRYNSRFVEGLNNKIRVIRRRCYGLLDSGRLFQRLFLDLEGYRDTNKLIC